MITITRRLTFCAGHRVFGHENKCANIHGHNYVVEVEVGANELDSIGRVIDFSVVKDEIGGYIDREWDHGFICYQDDFELVNMFEGKTKLYLLGDNPTAENMAGHLLLTGVLLMGKYEIDVHRVRLWETENCYAEVRS